MQLSFASPSSLTPSPLFNFIQQTQAFYSKNKSKLKRSFLKKIQDEFNLKEFCLPTPKELLEKEYLVLPKPFDFACWTRQNGGMLIFVIVYEYLMNGRNYVVNTDYWSKLLPLFPDIPSSLLPQLLHSLQRPIRSAKNWTEYEDNLLNNLISSQAFNARSHTSSPQSGFPSSPSPSSLRPLSNLRCRSSAKILPPSSLPPNLNSSLSPSIGKVKWQRLVDVFNKESSHLGGRRLAKHCRSRWLNHLNPELRKGGWSDEEDLLVLEGFLKYRKQWSKITKELGNRNDHIVKNRFYHILRNYNLKGKQVGTKTIEEIMMKIRMKKQNYGIKKEEETENILEELTIKMEEVGGKEEEEKRIEEESKNEENKEEEKIEKEKKEWEEQVVWKMKEEDQIPENKTKNGKSSKVKEKNNEKIQFEEKIKESSFDERKRVRKKLGRKEEKRSGMDKRRREQENQENWEVEKKEEEDPYKHIRVGFKRKFEVEKDEKVREGYKRREIDEDMFLQMIFDEIQKINVYNQINCHILD